MPSPLSDTEEEDSARIAIVGIYKWLAAYKPSTGSSVFRTSIRISSVSAFRILNGTTPNRNQRWPEGPYCFGTGTAWYKETKNEPYTTELVNLLKQVIKYGFTHIDGAEAYGTEQEMGQAIRECGEPRDKLFIVSKVQDTIHDIPKAIDQTLQKLGVSYVDLYLIHDPYWAKNDSELQAAWKQMENIKRDGKAKSIGVSNYLRPHLEATLKTATVIPGINQIEFHPYLQRTNDYVPWMLSQGIQVEAFKPMVPVTLAKGGPLDEPLSALSKKYQVPVDAILLRWQIQQRVIPITTSRHLSRLDEYATAVQFKLSEEDMAQITSIGRTHHFRAWGPDKFSPKDRT